MLYFSVVRATWMTEAEMCNIAKHSYIFNIRVVLQICCPIICLLYESAFLHKSCMENIHVVLVVKLWRNVFTNHGG